MIWTLCCERCRLVFVVVCRFDRLLLCVWTFAMRSKSIDCSICHEPMSYDAAYKVFWCEACDFPIENLSPVKPRGKRKRDE